MDTAPPVVQTGSQVGTGVSRVCPKELKFPLVTARNQAVVRRREPREGRQDIRKGGKAACKARLA